MDTTEQRRQGPQHAATTLPEAPAASCLLSLGWQEESPGPLPSASAPWMASSWSPLLATAPSPSFQEKAGLAAHRRSHGWEGGRGPPGKAGGTTELGGTDPGQAPPSQAEPGDRGLWAVGGGSQEQARTLHQCPYTMHKGAGGAGGRGPLVPVPSWEPLPGLGGLAEELDSVLGHSQALFLSQGENVTLLAGNGGPGGVGEENRASLCPREGSPLPPAPSWPLVPGSCTSRQQGQDRPG